MKAPLKILFAILLIAFGLTGCSTEPQPAAGEETMWEAVPALADVNVRYMLKNGNVLYLAGVKKTDQFSGLLYKTYDGIKWELIHNFQEAIGCLTFRGDTLYILSDSLYKYSPDNKLRALCGFYSPFEYTDMIFLKNNLYVITSHIDSRTYKLNPDGSRESIMFMPDYQMEYGGVKFFKNTKAADEILYVRPEYHNPFFYTFDGSRYNFLTDGLNESEKENRITNSAAFNNGVLYAAFNNYSKMTVKKLTGPGWEPHTAALPEYPDPSWVCKPMALTFYNNRLFASTNYMGVYEWKNDTAWAPISKGLQTAADNDKFFIPIPFLEEFKGCLFAGYGNPAFVVHPQYSTGAYKLDVNKIK